MIRIMISNSISLVRLAELSVIRSRARTNGRLGWADPRRQYADSFGHGDVHSTFRVVGLSTQPSTHSIWTSPNARAWSSTHCLASVCEAQCRVAGNLRTGVSLPRGTPMNAARRPGRSPRVSIHARSLPSLIRQKSSTTWMSYLAPCCACEHPAPDRVDCRTDPCQCGNPTNPLPRRERARSDLPPATL
jgi:hypothetical protein